MLSYYPSPSIQYLYYPTGISTSQVVQLAAALTDKLNVGLTELGLELSAQYQVSPAEQRIQIQQLADAILSDQSVGALAQLVEQDGLTDAQNRVSVENKIPFYEAANNDIIKPDKIVDGHSPTPKNAAPGSVIDHIDIHGKVNTRTFYKDDGLKGTEIHTGNHGNCKTHGFGVNGEHAHDYIWDENGRLKSKVARELTEEEKGRNSDIL